MITDLFSTKFISSRSIDLESKYIIEHFYKTDKEINKKFISRIKIREKEIYRHDKVPVNIIYREEHVYTTYYKANDIYRVSKGFFRINEFEENDSTLFILPCLGIPKYKLQFDSNFINAYLSHPNYKDKLGETLFLVYRYMPFDFYESNIANTFVNYQGFLTKEKDEDTRFDIIRVEIPEIFKEDVIKITKGHYREVSEKFKHAILLFDNRKVDDIIRQVLYDSDKLREKLEGTLGVQIPKELNLRTPPSMKKEMWAI